jgi:hypothetical protein
VKTRKKCPKQRIAQPVNMTGVDPIGRHDPGFPPNPHHWAPHFLFGVFLKYQHLALLSLIFAQN